MYKEHFLGASNELFVARYFLSKGYQVYFPVVQQGQVDLVVDQDKTLIRVQVKTATPNKSDGRYYLQCRTQSTNTIKTEPHKLYELLAVVYGSELWLIPASEIHSSNISLRTEKKKSEQWEKYYIE